MPPPSNLITQQIEEIINSNNLISKFSNLEQTNTIKLTDDEKNKIITAYSNYSELENNGISDIKSIPSYIKKKYGISIDDATNYQKLKDVGIATIADAQKKIKNAASTNATATNELSLKEKSRYFIHTNTKCKDSNGDLQNQSILIDNISDDTLWQKYNKGLMCSSTTSDYTGSNRMRELLSNIGATSLSTMDECRGVAVYTDASKSKTIRGYVSKADYENMDPSIINDEQSKTMNASVSSNTPAPSPVVIEKFSTLHSVYDDEKPWAAMENNIVTKFYFISISVILLYILFRLYEKSR
jgi:hypothetical protein